MNWNAFQAGFFVFLLGEVQADKMFGTNRKGYPQGPCRYWLTFMQCHRLLIFVQESKMRIRTPSDVGALIRQCRTSCCQPETLSD